MTQEPAEKKTLRRLEERLLRPAVRSSARAIAELLADDFIEFGSSGQVFGKQQVIESMLREPKPHLSLSDFKARVLARGVILVTYRANRRTGSRKRGADSLRSSIWKRSGGPWRMVFHQATPAKRRALPGS